VRLRDCSIKRAVDIVGETWTLLVIREALYGARRFEQFLANVGCAIPTDRTTCHPSVPSVGAIPSLGIEARTLSLLIALRT